MFSQKEQLPMNKKYIYIHIVVKYHNFISHWILSANVTAPLKVAQGVQKLNKDVTCELHVKLKHKRL